ncbi:integrase [Pseudomonas sp. BN411]|uniref:integrase n=1 Tax=Pseudomonas sp. BN411 TaxID=2567887 RepID=UPI002454B314|nr:integrase [Pseudomonas sp. BN411]MDH4564250.1 integrase [Pseudomonas sp. BN411]
MKQKQLGIHAESSAHPLKPEFLSTDIYYGMSFARIGPGTVISRSTDGTPLCFFEDQEWYLPAFAYNVKDNPYFKFLPFYLVSEHHPQNVELCKKLFIIKMFSINQKSGKPLRLASMHSVHSLLSHLCTYCDKNKLDALEVFGTFDTFKKFQKNIPTCLNRPLVALIRTLNNINSSERGLLLDGGIFPYMQKKSRESRKEPQQFPVIPSRILYIKYHQYNGCISDFFAYHDKIISFLQAAVDNPYYGRNKAIHSSKKPKNSSPEQLISHLQQPINFKTAIRAHGLEKLLTKYNWHMASSVTAFLALVQHCAKNLIHLFTLMRDHEVSGLRTGCLEPVKGWNNEALYVVGITTKMHSSPKPTKWITTEAILKPIEALEKINSILSPHAKTGSDYLFISPAAHPICNVSSKSKSIIQKVNLEEKLPPVPITEEDIQELETIDPYRNWRDDKRYQIGKPWRITSHQFRRSIAVFAGQSGLISLPALKRLLGHLTKVMSIYYMQGCSAKNYKFYLINPELVKELRKAKQEADGAMFIREALNSTERLLGARGRQVMEERQNVIWLHDPESYIREQVKRGLIAVKDTPVGSCASLEPCDKRAHGDFSTCPGCKHVIGKESVMNETIAVMRFDLAQLDVGSVEYRAEKQNLDDFIALRDRIIAKG